jgi:DUF1009 family protein
VTGTALIAGQGALPGLLVAALAAQGDVPLIAALDGFPPDLAGHDITTFRIERLVPFLDQLAASGVSRVAFAGAIRRPKIEPEMFDTRTAQLVPRLLGAMQSGDDAALRAVIGIFEEFDFAVVGADALAPDLVPAEGVLIGAPGEQDRADAARAAAIVAALGAEDIGQGAIVAGGLCLAVETLPGTDAMLEFATRHAGLRIGRGGVLYKAPKPGQDRRIDLPSIGPETVARAAGAGLSGIVWEAGGLILLDRVATVTAAEQAGLFLWARGG